MPILRTAIIASKTRFEAVVSGSVRAMGVVSQEEQVSLGMTGLPFSPTQGTPFALKFSAIKKLFTSHTARVRKQVMSLTGICPVRMGAMSLIRFGHLRSQCDERVAAEHLSLTWRACGCPWPRA